MSLLGLAASLGIVSGPSIGNFRFELFLPLPTDVSVVMLGASVLVSAWDARAAPVPSGGSVQWRRCLVQGVRIPVCLG